MTLRQHVRENLSLALPVMVSNFGHVLMGVCDNVMVGHLGAASLAAAGLATVVFNVFMLFGIGVSYAITPLVAEAAGKNDDGGIVEVLRHGLVINVVNAVVLIGVVKAGQQLLFHIGQPEGVVALTIPYLEIFAYSLVPIMVYQSFKQFAEGLSNTRAAMVVIIVSNVVNIALNYMLIYGHGGFPAMGLLGAAWATLLARVFMALAMGAYIFYMPAFRKFRAGFMLGHYSKSMFNKMLQLGIPSGAQFIFEVAAFDFSLVMMGWLGTQTQAAHQIAINLATLSYMTTAGLAAAATIRVGYLLGQHALADLRRAVYSLLAMAMALMVVFALGFVAFRFQLPAYYVNDAEVISIAATLLVVAGIFQLSDGTQVVCASALRGLQDVKVPSIFIFFSYWVIGLPLGYWLGFQRGLGGSGIWLGLLIGLTLTAIAMFMRLRWAMRNLVAPR